MIVSVFKIIALCQWIIYCFSPIFLVDFNAVRNDSNATSYMRAENVRIFIVSAKFLLNTSARYSNWAGDITKTSLVIFVGCNCFI